MRHFLRLTDLTRDDFFSIIERGQQHRADRALNPDFLRDRTIALMFEKSSTRTRLSFTVAITEMGGKVIVLEAGMTQLGRGETIEDTTEVFGRYLHGVMVRTFAHENLEKMAVRNRLPVINGLSDLHHPCQAMADYMTMQQWGLDIRKGVEIAFVGEPNNVCNSLCLGALHTGSRVRIAAPVGYEVAPEIRRLIDEGSGQVELTHDPHEAVRGAQVIYTDVWVSMGQEAEAEVRKKLFAPYSVTTDLLKGAADSHLVLHCLPAHRGEEISAEVMDLYADQIFDQAENRMHVQKAILEWIFE